MRPGRLNFADWLQPGDTVTWGQAYAEPLTLTRALVAQRKSLPRLRLFLGHRRVRYVAARACGHLRLHRLFRQWPSRAGAGRAARHPAGPLLAIAGALAAGRRAVHRRAAAAGVSRGPARPPQFGNGQRVPDRRTRRRARGDRRGQRRGALDLRRAQPCGRRLRSAGPGRSRAPEPCHRARRDSRAGHRSACCQPCGGWVDIATGRGEHPRGRAGAP